MGAVTRYAIGVVVVVLAVSSQYFLPEICPESRFVYGSLAGDVAVVYGLPVAAFLLLVGTGPLRGWRAYPRQATVEGLGWYGAMSLLGLLVTVALIFVYLGFDPGALNLLKKPNPALQAAAGNPWFFVGFSFVVGAFEETIFRGWIFGFWVGRSSRWLAPAILSSALFAGVHIYYGTTYGIAAPLIFPTLFFTGFAFAATYRGNGGNLFVPAALHGGNDAAAYLTLVSLSVGTDLHWALVLGAGLVGLLYYIHLRSGSGGPVDSPPGP